MQPLELFTAAKEWHDAGFCVLPAAPDGTKRPAVAWREYITEERERPDLKELEAFFSSGSFDGFGIIAGAISGNLEMIELEGPFESAMEALTTLEQEAQTFGIKPLLDDVLSGFSEVTPTGGLHFFLKVKDGQALGNTKLAQKIDQDTSQIKVLAETRGQGGWVVVSPSFGRTHPSGRPYRTLTGAPSKIPTLTADQRDELHRLFRTLDQTVVVSPPEFAQPASTKAGLSPGDDFIARTSWAELLVPAGWKSLGKSSRHGHELEYWRRPGKDVGISATTGGPGNHLWVFSTSTNLPAEQALSKFAVYTHMHHSGNYSQAAKQLSADGFGKQVEAVTAASSDFGADLEEAPESFGYTVLDWILTGNPPEVEPPEWATRQDGLKLFYRGRINGVYGDPETAKSWLAMCTIVEALAMNEKCVYLDADHNGSVEIVSRLILLGGDRKQLADPDFFRLYEPDSIGDLSQFVSEMREYKPALCIIDSIGEILPMMGLSSVDNDDITNAIRKLLKPIAHKAGACVITIDHLPKDSDARSSGYAIGGTAKKRAIDGSYLSASVKHSVAPGRIGRVLLKVEKDRAGKVREFSPANHAGIFILDSTDPQRISWSIEPEEAAQDGGLMPTNLMERVSMFLEEWTEYKPPSLNKIQRGIQGNDRGIARAVEVLTQEGHISESKAGQARTFTMLRPYRQGKHEITPQPLQPPQPVLQPAEGHQTSATSATSPLKGGVTEVVNISFCLGCQEPLAEVRNKKGKGYHVTCEPSFD